MKNQPSVTTGAASVTPALQQRTAVPFAAAARINSRILTEDTLWSGAVQVEGMVTVSAQATLTIKPGTVVRFGADSGILVLGRIVARGSAELPIIFTSIYSEPAPSDWFGIVLTGTGKKNILEALKILGAEVAIYARTSSFEIRRLHIANCSVALKLADSIAHLKDLVISECSSGLSAVKSEVDIESVIVERCGTGVSLLSSALTAIDLKITGSSRAALEAEKSHLRIEKSVFADNLAGITLIGCEGSVTGSRLVTNRDTAVTLSGSLLRFNSNLVSGSRIGVQLIDTLPAIWGNSIHGNSSYNILYLGEDLLYLGGNWFATVKPDLLKKTLFSKHADAIQILPLLENDPLSDDRQDFFKADN